MTDALLVRFRTAETRLTGDVLVGDIGVHEVTWLSDAEVPAAIAATIMCDAVSDWLDGLPIPYRAVA